jgi:hypothetical protein
MIDLKSRIGQDPCAGGRSTVLVRGRPTFSGVRAGNLLHGGMIGITRANIVSVVGLLVGKPARAMDTTFIINPYAQVRVLSWAPIPIFFSLVKQLFKVILSRPRETLRSVLLQSSTGEGSRVALPPKGGHRCTGDNSDALKSFSDNPEAKSSSTAVSLE